MVDSGSVHTAIDIGATLLDRMLTWDVLRSFKYLVHYQLPDRLDLEW